MMFYITSSKRKENYKSYKCKFYYDYNMINITYAKLSERRDFSLFKDHNLKFWEGWEKNPSVWDFLKIKHVYIYVGNYIDWKKGYLNAFDLSDDDLMYMKLMDWIE